MPSRTVTTCLVVGSLLFLLAFFNPILALQELEPSVRQIDPEYQERSSYASETDITDYEFAELTSHEQTIVETAIERDGNATFYMSEHDRLPPIFEDSRAGVGSDSPPESVAYVTYEGDRYRIAFYRQSPFPDFGVMGARLFVWGVGIPASFLIVRSGLLASLEDSRPEPRREADAGCAMLLFFAFLYLWQFNAHGYIWPIQ